MPESSFPSAPVVLAGAGPAGLTAAYVLAKAGIRPLVAEKSHQVGGISRTETYNGYRFDIGGHRFFTKVGEVEALWHEILGDDFVETPRMSRIYYKGKFYPYPLEIWPTLKNLGLVESARIGFSYLWAQIRRTPPAQNLEEWVTERFGKRLYETFFKTYTEKVWGIPCTDIRADWAAQRIKQLSLRRAVLAALTGKSSDTSLISSFQYPRLGPGMMWERATEHIEDMGGSVEMETTVTHIRHQPTTAQGDGAPTSRRRITSVTLESAEGETVVHPEHLVSSMPITYLIRQLDPPAPDHVLEAARSLSYRDFLIVTLVVDAQDLFPDNWIYIHSPEVQVGRIQNFKNWSPEMVPDASKTCLGLEYFCTRGDGIWTSRDEDLIALAKRELATIGLSGDAVVEDGIVIRQPMAYPVYDEDYKTHVATLQEYLSTFDNLQTVGRAGMHRYNNQDHSMLTALLAARNILGDLDGDAPHDLWNVNVERSYHEDFVVDEEAKKRVEEARRRPLPKHHTEPA